MNSSHGDLENTILNAIWLMEENNTDNISVTEVRENINNSNPQNWAYTTVKTVLDRLADKKVLSRKKAGKKFYYNAVYSREKMGKQSMEKLLRQYYNNDIDALYKAVKSIREESLALV